MALARQPQAGGTVRRPDGAHAVFFETAHHEIARRRVIVDDQDGAGPRERLTRLVYGGRGLLVRARRGESHRERRAGTGLAFDPDVPAHELAEPPRDREPEPRAAVLGG